METRKINTWRDLTDDEIKSMYLAFLATGAVNNKLPAVWFHFAGTVFETWFERMHDPEFLREGLEMGMNGVISEKENMN